MKRQTARAATDDDANLILKLYDMRREPRMRDARKWFGASFRAKTYDELMTLCPPGSEPNASYRMVPPYGKWSRRSSRAACCTRSCSISRRVRGVREADSGVGPS